MARLSRRLWGGTSLKTAAKEASRTVTKTKIVAHLGYHIFLPMVLLAPTKGLHYELNLC